VLDDVVVLTLGGLLGVLSAYEPMNMNKLDSGVGLGGRGGPGLSTASSPLAAACHYRPHTTHTTIDIGSGGGGSTLPNLEHRRTATHNVRVIMIMIKGVDPSHEVLYHSKASFLGVRLSTNIYNYYYQW
jgi:hypothetical protein